MLHKRMSSLEGFLHLHLGAKAEIPRFTASVQILVGIYKCESLTEIETKMLQRRSIEKHPRGSWWDVVETILFSSSSSKQCVHLAAATLGIFAATNKNCHQRTYSRNPNIDARPFWHVATVAVIACGQSVSQRWRAVTRWNVLVCKWFNMMMMRIIFLQI